MLDVNSRKRVLAALFLVFFTSCSRPCQKWEVEKIQTHYSCFDSSQLNWQTTNRFSGIDIQILCTVNGTSVFLDIYTFEFPFQENDPLKTQVVIVANDVHYEFLADRLAGGQRLLLPCEGCSLILDLLTASTSFTISVGCYSETVLPTNFSKAFETRIAP